ncbi:MAG: hypothetical protein A2Z28_01150 [Chloroflexi bacterium RBG_16_51_9]|nr:MAG: hypothetical protein A2Z28_01150 [Chloroflexi bacterium RBG_16_51_9]
MVKTPENASLGLSKEVILQMLKKGVKEHSYEGYAEFVHTYVIPNIAEVIAANNEAILFALKDSGSTYDSKY